MPVQMLTAGGWLQIVPLEKLTQVITSAQEPTSQRLTAAEEEAR